MTLNGACQQCVPLRKFNPTEAINMVMRETIGQSQTRCSLVAVVHPNNLLTDWIYFVVVVMYV